MALYLAVPEIMHDILLNNVLQNVYFFPQNMYLQQVIDFAYNGR